MGEPPGGDEHHSKTDGGIRHRSKGTAFDFCRPNDEATPLGEQDLQAVRREQAFQLTMLIDVVVALYPLKEPGVELSESVNIASLAVLLRLLKGGLFENLTAALKFFLLESTRQQANIVDDAYEDLQDRLWTRHLAHLVVRLLLLLTARFHLPASVLESLVILLEGAGFESGPLKSLPSHAKLESALTARDFDISAAEDCLVESPSGNCNNGKLFSVVPRDKSALDFGPHGSEISNEPNVNTSDSYGPNSGNVKTASKMTAKLLIILLSATDPSLVRWDIDSMDSEATPGNSVNTPTAKQKEHADGESTQRRNSDHSFSEPVSLSEVVFPTGRVAYWFDEKVTRQDVPESSRPLLDLLRNSESYDSTFPGLLLQYAAQVRQGKDLQSTTARRAVFKGIKCNLLKLFSSGDSDIAQVALHTVSSLLRQALLPLAPRWSTIIKADQLLFKTIQQNPSNDQYRPFKTDIWSRGIEAGPLLTIVFSVVNRLCSLFPPAIVDFAPLLHSIIETYPWQDILRPDLANDFGARTELSGETFANTVESSGDTNLFELHAARTPRAVPNFERRSDTPYVGGAALPATSGVGLPQVWLRRKFREEAFTSTASDEMTMAAPSGEMNSDAVSLEYGAEEVIDRLNLITPLFNECLNFASLIVATAPLPRATQIHSKLTTQPSLGQFYIPLLTSILRNLFSYLTNGKLQLFLLTAFSEERRTAMLRSSRRQQALPPNVFDDVNDDAAEADFRYSANVRLACLLSSVGALIRYFAAAGSPRLYVMTPAPLVLNSSSTSLSAKNILDFAYEIISANAAVGSLGLTTLGSVHNYYHLLAVKAVAIDGLATSFARQQSPLLESESLQSLPLPEELFVTFVTKLLPLIITDLNTLRQDAKQTSKSSGRNYWAAAVLGRLASSTASYLLSALTLRGTRRRYFVDGRAEWQRALLMAAQFTLNNLLLLLDDACKTPSLMSAGEFWRCALLVLKLIRLFLRGPLPLTGFPEIDLYTHEPFLPLKAEQKTAAKSSESAPLRAEHMRRPTEQKYPTGPENKHAAQFDRQPPLECFATSWIMKQLLILDSLALDAILTLARSAWNQLTSVSAAAQDSSCGVYLEPVCRVGVDILALLLQRDLLFIQLSKIRRSSSLGIMNPASSFRTNGTYSGKSQVNQSETGSDWVFLRAVSHVATALFRETTVDRPEASIACPQEIGARVPHAAFLLECILSEKHLYIRKKACYVFWQLAVQKPSETAGLLLDFKDEVAQLRVAFSNLLKDTDFQIQEVQDYLGAYGASLLEIPSYNQLEWGVDAALDPLNSDYIAGTTDEFQFRKPLRISAESSASDPASSSSITFNDEIAAMDCCVDTDITLEEFLRVELRRLQNNNRHTEINPSELASDKRDARCIEPDTTPCCLTSRYTALPIHERMEEKIDLLDEAARLAADVSGWMAFKARLDYELDDKEYIETALLLRRATPDLGSLGPLISGGLCKVVATACDEQLPRDKYIENFLIPTSLFDSHPPPKESRTNISAVHYPPPLEGWSTKLLVLHMLRQLREALTTLLSLQHQSNPSSSQLLIKSGEGDPDIPSVAHLLLGFTEVHTPNRKGQEKGNLPTQKTFASSIPLPYLACPFEAPDEDASWSLPPVTLIKALALTVEAADLYQPGWVLNAAGLFGSTVPLDFSNEATDPSEESVIDLTCFYSSGDLSYHYENGQCTVLALEILFALISDVRTLDTAMHVLCSWIPHRHALLNSILRIPIQDTLPLPLVWLRNSALCLWTSILAQEMQVCSHVLETSSSGGVPDWVVEYPQEPRLLLTRMSSLKFQCAQVAEASIGFLQTPIDTSRDGAALAAFAAGADAPAAIAAVLLRLTAFERIAHAYPLYPTNSATMNSILVPAESEPHILARIVEPATTECHQVVQAKQTQLIELKTAYLMPYVVGSRSFIQMANKRRRSGKDRRDNATAASANSGSLSAEALSPLDVFTLNARSLAIAAATAFASAITVWCEATLQYVLLPEIFQFTNISPSAILEPLQRSHALLLSTLPSLQQARSHHVITAMLVTVTEALVTLSPGNDYASEILNLCADATQHTSKGSGTTDAQTASKRAQRLMLYKAACDCALRGAKNTGAPSRTISTNADVVSLLIKDLQPSALIDEAYPQRSAHTYFPAENTSYWTKHYAPALNGMFANSGASSDRGIALVLLTIYLAVNEEFAAAIATGLSNWLSQNTLHCEVEYALIYAVITKLSKYNAAAQILVGFSK